MEELFREKWIPLVQALKFEDVVDTLPKEIKPLFINKTRILRVSKRKDSIAQHSIAHYYNYNIYYTLVLHPAPNYIHTHFSRVAAKYCFETDFNLNNEQINNDNPAVDGTFTRVPYFKGTLSSA